MPKKAKAKKPARGIAVKQKQTVKQTVKVIVGDIGKKTTRRRRTNPKGSVLIQPAGGGISGAVVPDILRQTQPYEFVANNRQPIYDFERIQQQPIQGQEIKVLDFKANNPSVSASGLIGMQGQKALMDESAKPVIKGESKDITEEYNEGQKAKTELQKIKEKQRASVEKRRETMAKKKLAKLEMTRPKADIPDLILPSYREVFGAGSSSDTIIVPVQPKRYLGPQELEIGFKAKRDKVLIDKIKAFRKEQKKKRGIEAFKQNVPKK